MSSAMQQFNTTLSLSEMEAMIRRVVKEAVHEEFTRLLLHPGSVAENWAHEGADDPAGDELLLAEALAERERYRTNPEEWMDGDRFRAKTAESQRRTTRRITELRGLGKEIWQDIDAQQYVNALRNEWDTSA